MVTRTDAGSPTHADELAPGRWERVVVVVAVLGAGLNLRAAVTSLGAVLEEVFAGLGITATTAGIVTALPVVCFALVGPLAASVARRRVGAHRLVVAGLLAIAVGLAARSVAPGTAVFLAESVLALGGIAAVNVLLPPLIKQHFPERIGFMTGLYSMSVAIGVSAPAALSIPVGEITGYGWRGGLGVWAAVAALAAVPWIVLVARARAAHHPGTKLGTASVADGRLRLSRSPTAIAVGAFFGLQSLSAFALMGWLPAIYRDAGLSPAHAAVLLALTVALGIPAALIVPALAARRGQTGYVVVVATAATGGGYLGLLLAPAAVPWLWTVLLASMQCTYPLAITLVSLRTRDPATATQLSGFAQGGGYTIAAAGPFAVGALLDVTGGWTAPLTVLLGALALQLAAGLLAARPRHVEDETARAIRQAMR